MDKIIATLQKVEAGQMVTIVSPLAFDNSEMEVMILNKRGDPNNLMLDVDTSIFGVHMFKATLKVTPHTVTMFVEKEAA